MATIYAKNKTTNEWEKVGPAANATDSTLTLKGSPADAKATGDAINNIQTQIDNMSFDGSDIDVSEQINTSISNHNTSNTAHANIREQISQLSSEKVDITELFDTAQSSNYADMSALKIGMIHTNGSVYTGGNYDKYCYFENYIPVDEGDVISLQFARVSSGVRYWNVNGDYTYANTKFQRVTAYDANKNALSTLGISSSTGDYYSYTVPAGVKFIRVTFEKPLFYSTDDNVRGTDISIVKNATSIIPYEEYGAIVISTIKEKHIPNYSGGVTSITGTLYVSLPDAVHVKVGNTFTVYYRNIFSRNDVMLWLGSHTNLTTRYYNEYFSVVASAAGSFNLPWKVYDQAGNLLESGTLTIIATAKVPTETTKAIVIGDSTVNDGTMTNKAIDLYAADGATLALYGTRGSGKHEGRGGWTAKAYCTMASSGDIENPFYNNGFDFAYYMTNQGYSGIQAVAIQLGINDIFQIKGGDLTQYDSSAVLEYINQMVTSILAYNNSIKVIINLPTTPNSNGTSFTETYGTSQIYWFYNHNIIRFAKELKEYFAGNSSVIVSASNCILDTKTQIRDGVHPTSEGYNALGQRLYEVLISIVDGTVIIVPLLDISTRLRVAHSGNTIAATGTRELSTEKCYETTFNGTRAENALITSYTALSSSSFSIQSTGTSGKGIEFPVALEVGKTYTITYTVDNTARGYLVKYNSDTTYASNTNWSTAAGTFTKTITPEEGYIYSICFCPMIKNTLVTFSNISLTEN